MGGFWVNGQPLPPGVVHQVNLCSGGCAPPLLDEREKEVQCINKCLTNNHFAHKQHVSYSEVHGGYFFRVIFVNLYSVSSVA